MPDMLVTAITFSLSQVVLSLLLLYRVPTWGMREWLADPIQAQLPVLSMAMDAGFRSRSSFNKAFKETRGVTPSAWRKSQLKK